LTELSAVRSARVETIARAVFTVETAGEGFFEITREVARNNKIAPAERRRLVLDFDRVLGLRLDSVEATRPSVITDEAQALVRERDAVLDAHHPALDLPDHRPTFRGSPRRPTLEWPGPRGRAKQGGTAGRHASSLEGRGVVRSVVRVSS